MTDLLPGADVSDAPEPGGGGWDPDSTVFEVVTRCGDGSNRVLYRTWAGAVEHGVPRGIDWLDEHGVPGVELVQVDTNTVGLWWFRPADLDRFDVEVGVDVAAWYVHHHGPVGVSGGF